MNCGHLFNGIGGFALAANWMGWNNVMHCEIDPFCNKVMKHHFPNSYQHEDVRTTEFSIWRNRIELLTGGFPCQPYSHAGQRKGKEDERHLWPFMLTAIRTIQPRWVVGENVSGLISWNGGLVFDEVQSDLEAEGYEVVPFLLPACAVNAPHRRNRIWFVAYASGIRFDAGRPQQSLQRARQYSETRPVANAKSVNWDVSSGPENGQEKINLAGIGGEEFIANADSFRQRKQTDEINAFAEGGQARVEFSSNSERSFNQPNWDNFPTQSPICNGNDGFPNGLVDIAFSKWHEESLKALGNAIVPQAAFQIFKAIDQVQNQC